MTGAHKKKSGARTADAVAGGEGPTAGTVAGSLGTVEAELWATPLGGGTRRLRSSGGDSAKAGRSGRPTKRGAGKRLSKRGAGGDSASEAHGEDFVTNLPKFCN